MKRIIAIILFINISINVFSQNDSLKKHEIGILFDIEKQSNYWYTSKYDANDKYNLLEVFMKQYNNKFGVYYKYYLKQQNIFDFKILYNSISLNLLDYKSKELFFDIGYSFKLIKNNKFYPYIGIFLINRFVFDENLLLVTNSKYPPYETYNHYYYLDNYYQIGIAPKIGISIIVHKKFQLNIEISSLFNKFSLKSLESEYYKYYYKMGSLNFSLGYKF